MSFVEFIKNPSAYIWGFIDKSGKKESSSNTNSASISLTPNLEYPESPDLNVEKRSTFQVIQDDFKGFVVAVQSKDWKWLFRGKTGFFLKISIPTVLSLYVISMIFAPKPQLTTKDTSPSVIDPGDTFTKPKFKSSSYLNGSFTEGKFLVYSPYAGKINEFGLRGLLLDSITTDPSINYYYPLNKKKYLFYKDGALLMRYMKLVPIPNTYPQKTQEVEDFVTIVDSLPDYKELKDLHITYDDNFCFILNNKFYVFNLLGEEVKEYELKPNTISPTFYGGEVYYVKEVPSDDALVNESTSTNSVKTAESKSTFYLIRLNKNDEEVYSQNLGTLRVQKISVVNGDRYLVLIERPSENSFFNIQMRDSGKRTIFNVQPTEKDVKVTLTNNLYFNSEDNTIFMQGNGVAKLFNLNGEQLWIN